MWLLKGNLRDLCSGRMAEYLDNGGGHINLHIQLGTHTHTNVGRKNWKNLNETSGLLKCWCDTVLYLSKSLPLGEIG